MSRCYWCNAETELEVYEDFTGIHNICSNCAKEASNDTCITCKQPLYGEMSIKGECSICQQNRATREEKKRSEIMNGLGVMSDLTKQVSFTEKDYEEWVTFGQDSFSTESRQSARRKWIYRKLIDTAGWSDTDILSSYNDIEYLMQNFAHKIFNDKYSFVLNNGGSRGLRGLNIIESHGNVMIVEK